MGVPGRRDQAVTFNGIDQLMTIGNAGDLNFGPDDDFTVAFWVRPNAQVSQAAGHAIVEKWAGAGGYPFAVHYDQATGKIIATRSDGSQQPAVSTDRSIIDNAFHHVAYVRNGGYLSLYLDGALSGGPVADTTSGATGNDASIYVGMRSDGSDAFAGTLDELFIYDRALADYEVANLMAYGEGTWVEAALVGDRWSYTIPAGDLGIEGIFQLNVRGIDALGNVTPLSGRRVWRGEIDTKPPSVEFLAATDSSSGETVTRYECIARDFSLLQESKNNGVQTTSCVPGNPPPKPTFHNSGLTLTTYDQVDPWYATTITDTSRLYQITGVVTLPGEPVQGQTMVACDRYAH
ncbi:MAG: LamG domain-containing protein, partial [Caldilineaceae bacterium]